MLLFKSPILTQPLPDPKPLFDFNLPKFDLPNPTEWATNFGSSLIDSMNTRLGEIIHELIVDFMSISTDICIIVGLVACILYIFGWKKGKSVPLIAWAVSIIIKIIGTVMLGV